MSDKEFNPDAYVVEVPESNRFLGTHAIVVDLIYGEEIVHQVVAFSHGKTSADGDARNLNHWRDQLKVTA